MKLSIAAAAVCAALVTAPAASAATQSVYLSGQVTGPGGSSFPAPVDPNFSIGTKIEMKFSYDTKDIIWGSDGYGVIAADYFMTTDKGFTFFMSDLYDGAATLGLETNVTFDPFDYSERKIGNGAILFKDGKIQQITWMSSPLTSDQPVFRTNGSFNVFRDCMRFSASEPFACSASQFVNSDFSNLFEITNGDYGNAYPTPGFIGEWDYAGSYIGVPEPQTWALMILGFGLAGGMLRRRATRLA